MTIPAGWKINYYAGNGSIVPQDSHGVCPHCRNASTFKIDANLIRKEGNGKFRLHLILACNSVSCHKTVYLTAAVKNMAIDPSEEFFIHPSLTVDLPHTSVPKQIADDWIEAQKAMEAGARKAAAVMCRRVLYGAILDKKCKEHPLREGLKQLIQQERLPGIFDDWLPAIKDDGHDAAHPHRALEIDPENVSETMEYTSELLRFLYIEPYEFQVRKARNTGKP